MTPAPSTTTGKGTWSSASSRKAVTATTTSARRVSARFPILRTAWTTTATTAGASPRNKPVTIVVSPCVT